MQCVVADVPRKCCYPTGRWQETRWLQKEADDRQYSHTLSVYVHYYGCVTLVFIPAPGMERHGSNGVRVAVHQECHGYEGKWHEE